MGSGTMDVVPETILSLLKYAVYGMPPALLKNAFQLKDLRAKAAGNDILIEGRPVY